MENQEYIDGIPVEDVKWWQKIPIVGGIMSFVDLFTGRGEQRKNRETQIAENEKDRQFNAEQAQISRDWQERIYRQYESPQAQVTQRMAAGLNPTDGVSSQSVGSASTASASSSPIPSQSPLMPQILMSILDYKLRSKQTSADVRQTNAETQLINEQTRTQWFENARRDIELNGYADALETQRALLRAQLKGNEISNEEYQLRLDMLNEYRDNGGNLYEQQAEVDSALADLHRAETNESKARAAKIANERLVLKLEYYLKRQEYRHKENLNPLLEEFQKVANEIQMHDKAIAELKELIEQAWNNPSSWPKIRTLFLDFLRHNVSLYGGSSTNSSHTSYD